jgi:hypothetical protein
VHLERALSLAGEHGINQFLFDAEEALLKLETPVPPPRVSSVVPLDVEEVANAIKQLRNTVGVA